MNALINSTATRKKILSIIIAAILALALFPSFTKAAEAAPIVSVPTGVTGNILPKNKSGDTSDWIEIATNGDYSLILRRDVLSVGYVHFDNRNSNVYQTSYVRDVVNNWYNKTLPSSARLREFAVKSNPLQEIGYYGVTTSGFSKPTVTAAPTGNDVAFLLSFAEAAMFCSNRYGTDYYGRTWATSPTTARSNLALLNNPAVRPANDFWWLRTSDNNFFSPKCLCTVGSHITNQPGYVYLSSYGACLYVRPAIWVNTNIFYDKGTINVHYLDAETLEPLAADDSFEVPPGYYGPITPKDFRFYLPGELAPYSDPVTGTISIREEKNITFLYTRGSALVVVVHLDLVNYSTLGMDPYPVRAGDYGPYGPANIPGYGTGELIPGSHPPIGVLDIGDVVYIYYGYQKVTRTVNILYLTTDGLKLYEEVFTVPLGHYGLYQPYLFAGYEPGVWDDTSDPPEGLITEDNTVLTIVFLYTPR